MFNEPIPELRGIESDLPPWEDPFGIPEKHWTAGMFAAFMQDYDGLEDHSNKQARTEFLAAYKLKLPDELICSATSCPTHPRYNSEGDEIGEVDDSWGLEEDVVAEDGDLPEDGADDPKPLYWWFGGDIVGWYYPDSELFGLLSKESERNYDLTRYAIFSWLDKTKQEELAISYSRSLLHVAILDALSDNQFLRGLATRVLQLGNSDSLGPQP